jgi:TolC family type I secretion outer membrane protein
MRTKKLFLDSVIWVLLGLCVYGGVQAQTLTEVVQNALANYPALQAARAKTEAARSDIERARAAHYPQIAYGFTRSKYSNTELPASTKQNMNTPSVKLNLWAGGRIEADAERAEALTFSSEQLEAVSRDDVAQQAAEAYINWARTLDLYALASKNVASLNVTLDDIRKIVEVDTGRRIDFDQAKVRLDNATLAKLQRQTELAQARQRLRRFWQGPLAAQPTGLVEALGNPSLLGQMPEGVAQVVDHINDDLPNIAQQKAQVAAATAAVNLAKGQYWPSVDLTSTRQMNLVPSTQPFGAATYREDTLTQVQLSMPLYSGGATAAGVNAAVSQLSAAQNTLDEVRLLAREKAVLAYEDWRNAKDRAAQGLAQSRVGEQVVEGYRQQFRLARRQLLDLLNIQAESFGYQSAAMTAFYDEQVARVRLLAVMGDLAKRF